MESVSCTIMAKVWNKWRSSGSPILIIDRSGVVRNVKDSIAKLTAASHADKYRVTPRSGACATSAVSGGYLMRTKRGRSFE